MNVRPSKVVGFLCLAGCVASLLLPASQTLAAQPPAAPRQAGNATATALVKMQQSIFATQTAIALTLQPPTNTPRPATPTPHPTNTARPTSTAIPISTPTLPNATATAAAATVNAARAASATRVAGATRTASLPTATPRATLAAVPTPRPATVQPTAVPPPTAAPPTAAPPTAAPPTAAPPTATATPAPAAGGPTAITPLSPPPDAAVSGSVTFAWQADAPLGPGQVFELVFWSPAQGYNEGRALNAASPTTTVQLNVDNLGAGARRWGVWLAQAEPYTRLRFLGEGGALNIGGGSSGSSDSGGSSDSDSDDGSGSQPSRPDDHGGEKP